MNEFIAIYGSPRRDGNSAALLKQTVAGARWEGAHVEEVFFRDYKISPCLEIYNCLRTSECAIQDDFPKIPAELESDILLNMSEDYLIDISKLHVIQSKRAVFCSAIGKNDFPIPHSTDIYPEWPLAKLSSTSDELASKVAIALLRMSGNEDAAKQAGIMGWDIARNYQPVHDLYLL